MALWVCDDCTTKYAVGLSRCPRCHSESFHEDGEMPKISKHAGPTHQPGDVADPIEPLEPEPADEAVDTVAVSAESSPSAPAVKARGTTTSPRRSESERVGGG